MLLNARFMRAALLFAFCGACSAAEAKKYNVLFIAVDDLKPLLGCYGAAGVKSPNIDSLAARGLAFNRAYCQQAVCSPTRTSLLTGHRPDSTGVYDLQTHFRNAGLPDVVTLPQDFKNNGYHTQSLSKIYHGGYDDPPSWSEPSWFPRQPGGSEWHDPDTVTRLRQRRAEAAADERPKAKGKGKKARTVSQDVRGPAWENFDAPEEEYPDGRTAAHAVEVLRERAKDKDTPFFLAVGFIKPHLPFISPKKYWDLYNEADLKLAPNPFPPKDVPAVAMTTFGELRAYEGIPAKGPLSDAQAMKMIHGYYAAVSFMDAQVGKVLAELDRLGLRDSTIVILWGDHGWHLGDHGLWCKHTNFESATHVPLIISVPGQKTAGSHSDALVEFVDIYPSLAELCGLPTPPGLEGTSFAPLIEQPSRSWKTAAFSQYPRAGGVMGYTMRTERYRYTEWVKGPKDGRKVHAGWPTAWGQEVVGRELYDHEKDPEENVNLAEQPEMKDKAAELSKTLHAGWKEALPK
jgi:arylsulfatase A-like enzyme